MPDLYEVLLVDGQTRWHVGWVVDDEAETDVLLRDGRHVPVFASRAALEQHAEQHRLSLQDDLPDEIDLDLGGWLTSGTRQPSTAEVCELWQLLYDDPLVGTALGSEDLGEAYDDLVEDAPDWFATHGAAARPALADAVRRLRSILRPA
ncbi:MAG: hypothetical protein WD794_16550 [Mycobacteriales bacterium]